MTRPPLRRRAFTLLLLVLAAAPACAPAEPDTPMVEEIAPEPSADERAVLAVAEAALVAISDEDMVAFTDLMFEEAVIAPTGVDYIEISSWAAERARELPGEIVERGFDARAQVSGRVASVWLPYDLYLDGEWSHCGVDIFTMVKDEEEWRILSVAWSRLQPPACAEHPDGPPA